MRYARPAPPFVRLLAHPLRWQLLHELARSDRRVGELAARVGQPQNLVSYHLARLRSDGLVASRRSSLDGRDTYYRLDLERCAQSLSAAGAALHPGLTLGPVPPVPAGQRDRRRRRHSVLFMCTGNSARSQMAEALARERSGGRVDACSAGSHPKPLNPCAVRVMAQRGIDISGQRSKHLDAFTGRRFDYVITLCDKVREVCPEFPGHPGYIHWSMPDPAAAGDSDRDSYPAFQAAAADLETRIRFWLAALAALPAGAPAAEAW